MNHIIEKDFRYVWHPFMDVSKMCYEDLTEIVSAKGIYVKDSRGNEYIDAIGSWWAQIHGHSHPRIVKAIVEQLNTLDHIHFAGNTHKWAVELSERIMSMLGEDKFGKALFSDDGSTAVEIAIKTAFQYFLNMFGEKRDKFISLKGAYHGDTIAGVSLGGIPVYHDIFEPFVFDVLRADVEDTQKIEQFLTENKKRVAGIIVEPLIQGAAGMRIHDKKYLKQIKTLCREHNVLLIFDEVFTGFGRTGEMFAFQTADVIPDIICLGKGLGGGSLTTALTAVSNEIFEVFKKGKYPEMHHGHTFTANPIMCRAGIESLNIFEDENLIEINREKSAYFQKRCVEVLCPFKAVKNVRTLGMISAFDIIDTDTLKAPKNMSEIHDKVIKKCLENGVMIRPIWNTIYFVPSLHITKNEIDEMVERVKNGLISSGFVCD